MPRLKKIRHYTTADSRTFEIPDGVVFIEQVKAGVLGFRVHKRVNGECRYDQYGLRDYLTLDHAFQAACNALRERLLETGTPLGVRIKTTPHGPGISPHGKHWISVRTFNDTGRSKQVFVKGNTAVHWEEARTIRAAGLEKKLNCQLAAIPTDVVPVVLNKYGKPLEE